MEKHYDVVVIGSGAGLIIADYAAKNGLRTAVIEQGPFGGTCVNWGCIPSKMLIYPADIVRIIQQSEKLNIEVSAPELDFPGLIARVTKEVGGLASNIQSHYKKSDKIDIYPDTGFFESDRKIRVKDLLITGDRFYLAIGARAKIPPIVGLNKTPYITSSDALRSTQLAQKTAIIGGGFIAAELGHLYSTAGSEVEFFSRSGFLKNLDADVRKDYLEEFLKTHTIHEFAEVVKVSHENGRFEIEFVDNQGKRHTSHAGSLLVAVGRQSWADSIQIQNTSIDLTKEGFIEVDDHLRTSAENTWACGDCIGRHLFRHIANFEARYLVGQLLGGKEKPIQYPPVPFAIFTHPQIGVAGKTEEELNSEGIDTFSGVSEYKKSDMGKARRSACGIVKLIFDKKTKQLISAHIVGEDAATMIHTPIAFIHMKATVDDIAECVFVHPALPEVVSSAAHNAKKKLNG